MSKEKKADKKKESVKKVESIVKQICNLSVDEYRILVAYADQKGITINAQSDWDLQR